MLSKTICPLAWFYLFYICPLLETRTVKKGKFILVGGLIYYLKHGTVKKRKFFLEGSLIVSFFRYEDE
jgi:hypothetical protein